MYVCVCACMCVCVCVCACVWLQLYGRINQKGGDVTSAVYKQLEYILTMQSQSRRKLIKRQSEFFR